jgi:hypothetical protein
MLVTPYAAGAVRELYHNLSWRLVPDHGSGGAILQDDRRAFHESIPLPMRDALPMQDALPLRNALAIKYDARPESMGPRFEDKKSRAE